MRRDMVASSAMELVIYSANADRRRDRPCSEVYEKKARGTTVPGPALDSVSGILGLGSSAFLSARLLGWSLLVLLGCRVLILHGGHISQPILGQLLHGLRLGDTGVVRVIQFEGPDETA